MRGRSRSFSTRIRTFVGVLLLAAGIAPRVAAQQPNPEDIQQQREDAERKRLEFMDEKARVDHINERVRLYKELMASVPFEPVPNTSNMVQVFMNGHDLRDVASRLYDLADGSSPTGFAATYWPTVLYLNRAKDYDGGLPRYGKLDPQVPNESVALFPNIRKHGYIAVVAPIENADSAAALDMTTPVVLAYRRRLAEEVVQLAARGGDVWIASGPASLPDENHTRLFRGEPDSTREQYPPRKSSDPSQYVSLDPVPVERLAPLDPAPPAAALRQGINMLGPTYQGYNLQYQPSKLDLQPEVGVIALLGARTPTGRAVTEGGTYFAFNQRLFNSLLVNESAFVAFSSSEAPVVNGGSLSGGLDINFGPFNLAGMVGFTGLRVVGETKAGPSYAGRIRVPFGEHVMGSATLRVSNIEHFRVIDAHGVGRSGVTKASYIGLGLTFR
jgi:hypothetical protein